MTGLRSLAKVRNGNAAKFSWSLLMNMYLRHILGQQVSMSDPNLHFGRQLGMRLLKAFQISRARHKRSLSWYPHNSKAVPLQGCDSNQPVLLPVLNFHHTVHQLHRTACRLCLTAANFRVTAYHSQPHVLGHASITDSPF